LTLVQWFAVGTRWWALRESKTAGIWQLCVSRCPFVARSPPRLAGWRAGGGLLNSIKRRLPAVGLPTRAVGAVCHPFHGQLRTTDPEQRSSVYKARIVVRGPQTTKRELRSPIHEDRATVAEPRSQVHEARSPVAKPRSRNHDPRTPIPEPRSPIPDPRDQSGRPPS
jgi:hypothetical protein